MAERALPYVWPLKLHAPLCEFPVTPETRCWLESEYGIGFNRPVRKFCREHLMVMVWGWLIDYEEDVLG